MDNKATILLIDDNEEILETVSAELSDLYKILTAVDGKEGLEILSQEAVQLVISDIMMPVMDGYELCRQIKSNFNYSHIPVILLTAKNTLKSKIQGLEQGADAYIEKPFDIEYLLVQVANLLANRSKLRNYFTQSPLTHIKSIAHSKSDERFLEQLKTEIFSRLGNEDLEIEHLAATFNMSRTTFFRKIKALSGLTPVEFINLTRLKKAAELLAEDEYKIFEIAFMVGFGSQTSFGRSFTRQFGITPSEFQKRKREEIGL
ncbi:response regulator transcription factor [Desertivirga brevis]|uniref:response regulator transcription factor n=1 Tax=Desertivirga brevis TaxID=2810310 RepID=UPI001A96D338|nr:response regulator [Pedobacter sp. SYSU D00873]